MTGEVAGLSLPAPDTERLSRFFIELASIKSPSGAERGVADVVLSELRALGLRPVEDGAAKAVGGDCGNIMCVVPGGENSAAPAVALGAHMDTVVPTGEIRPVLADGVFRNAAGTILGADDKVAVAAIIHATELLRGAKQPHPTFEIFFTVGEEVGLRGAKSMEAGALHSPRAVVFDSAGPVGGITVKAPSQNTILARYLGKAAHAGVEPEKGRNAIVAAAKAIAGMPIGRIDEETTSNIGLIQGGTAGNIVADMCLVTAEARSHDEAKLARLTADMVEAFQMGAAAVGVDAQIDVREEYRAFALSRTRTVVRLCSAAIRAIGLTPEIQAAGGGCDANVLNAVGIETANVTSGMRDVHTRDEHLLLEDLEALTRLMMAIVFLSSEYAE